MTPAYIVRLWIDGKLERMRVLTIDQPLELLAGDDADRCARAETWKLEIIDPDLSGPDGIVTIGNTPGVDTEMVDLTDPVAAMRQIERRLFG